MIEWMADITNRLFMELVGIIEFVSSDININITLATFEIFR